VQERRSTTLDGRAASERDAALSLVHGTFPCCLPMVELSHSSLTTEAQAHSASAHTMRGATFGGNPAAWDETWTLNVDCSVTLGFAPI
jgi:hypothetical protein